MIKKNLQKLIDIFESSSITYIEISSFWGFRKITLGKNKELHHPDGPVESYSESDKAKKTTMVHKEKVKVEPGSNVTEFEEGTKILPSDTLKILSPLVGTFYLSPKPGSPPFISEGDTVEVGQTLCIIEAMKIFNEIESEYDGKIVKILVEDGTPIEYDQPLIILKK